MAFWAIVCLARLTNVFFYKNQFKGSSKVKRKKKETDDFLAIGVHIYTGLRRKNLSEENDLLYRAVCMQYANTG